MPYTHTIDADTTDGITHPWEGQHFSSSTLTAELQQLALISQGCWTSQSPAEGNQYGEFMASTHLGTQLQIFKRTHLKVHSFIPAFQNPANRQESHSKFVTNGKPSSKTPNSNENKQQKPDIHY